MVREMPLQVGLDRTLFQAHGLSPDHDCSTKRARMRGPPLCPWNAEPPKRDIRRNQFMQVSRILHRIIEVKFGERVKFLLLRELIEINGERRPIIHSAKTPRRPLEFHSDVFVFRFIVF